MWVPAEVKDPILLHAPTRKSVGYFGAVRLRDGKLLTKREEKVFDAETFWQFLKLLRQVSSRSGRRVAVISDNAKYHHALLHREWRQQLEPRFALHFLPPYTPQLNPIERILEADTSPLSAERFLRASPRGYRLGRGTI